MGQQDKREAIAHHGRECENACRLAAFADEEGMPTIAAGLRKLAEHHSEQAFKWTAKPDPIPGLTHSNAGPEFYDAKTYAGGVA